MISSLNFNLTLQHIKAAFLDFQLLNMRHNNNKDTLEQDIQLCKLICYQKVTIYTSSTNAFLA